jgi:hypothetical protein
MGGASSMRRILCKNVTVSHHLENLGVLMHRGKLKRTDLQEGDFECGLNSSGT